mgnify:CR=1 FL=1
MSRCKNINKVCYYAPRWKCIWLNLSEIVQGFKAGGKYIEDGVHLHNNQK